MENQNNLPKIISCKLFDINKLSFTEFTEYEGTPAIKTSFPKYEYTQNNSNNLIFETDLIKFTQYGIPCLNKHIYKTDKDRRLIKIPYDPLQPACVELFQMLKMIDDYMINKKQNLFGNKAPQYKYIPLIKTPENNNDDDDDDDKNPKHKKIKKNDYCIVKFITNYESGELITAVFEKKDKFNPIHLDIKTITDLAQHLTWNSSARFIITVNKIWCEKYSKKKGEPKDYGVVLKCYQVEIVPQQNNNIKTIMQNTYSFSNSNINNNSDSEYIYNNEDYYENEEICI